MAGGGAVRARPSYRGLEWRCAADGRGGGGGDVRRRAAGGARTDRAGADRRDGALPRPDVGRPARAAAYPGPSRPRVLGRPVVRRARTRLRAAPRRGWVDDAVGQSARWIRVRPCADRPVRAGGALAGAGRAARFRLHRLGAVRGCEPDGDADHAVRDRGAAVSAEVGNVTLDIVTD